MVICFRWQRSKKSIIDALKNQTSDSWHKVQESQSSQASSGTVVHLVSINSLLYLNISPLDRARGATTGKWQQQDILHPVHDDDDDDGWQRDLPLVEQVSEPARHAAQECASAVLVAVVWQE